MFLYGKNSVQERLKTNPKSIKRIYLRDNFDAPQIFDIIKSANIPLLRVSERELMRIKRADRLQGIVAEVQKFEYTPFKELLAKAKRDNLSLVFLDSINDPHNLGSIMRTLACLGGFAMVIPKYNACQVNDTVIHVASGGENFVPVSLVSNLSSSLITAKKEGFWAIGALVDAAEDINKMVIPFPLSLVLGSEGKGIRPGLKKQLELGVRIPMSGVSLSFNVATACAILCHEIAKQRNK
jgi:23S rRNA (guanosine2251-2'-O)-methyltransferase